MNDLRFAMRQLAKHRGFTVLVVLILSLGIGANTAIFSVLNTLMLRSLPVQEPDRLVQPFASNAQGGDPHFSYPMYERFAESLQCLSGLFAAGTINKERMVARSMGATENEFVLAQAVSGNFFQVLGVRPFAGRLLNPADDVSQPAEGVVVISHGFWQRRFAGDASMIGKSIVLNDHPVTIVGILPAGFFGFVPGENPDLWSPLHSVSPRQLGEGTSWLQIVGRLAPGKTLDDARTELATKYQQYLQNRAEKGPKQRSPEERQRILRQSLQVRSAATGWSESRGTLRRPLLILSTIVALVLLIACANVASLLLARGVARTREFSIRAALGAGRLRLIRQLLAESLLLAVMGGGIGLFIARWGSQLLASYLGLQSDPVSFNLQPDSIVLAFTALLSLGTGIIFGLAPALSGSRLNLAAAMKGSDGSIAAKQSRHLMQQMLVVAQVASSLVLLVGAGLFMRTLQQFKGMDLGFNRENVFLFDLDFNQRIDDERRISAYRDLLQRLKNTPGVLAASASSVPLLTNQAWGQRLVVEGLDNAITPPIRCFAMSVAPDYFNTMGISMVGGRDFGPQDVRPPGESSVPAAFSAVINQSLARTCFGDANPIGRRLKFPGDLNQSYEVVGIVADAKYRSLREPSPMTLYVSCFQVNRDWDLTFAVRATQESAATFDAIRRAVREGSSLVQIRELRTMEDSIDAALRQERTVAQLGGAFSMVALALACLGLYGTLAFSVVQRTREIGVRVALGAQRGDILSLVLGRGLKLAAIGAGIGLIGALAATRYISSLLYGVTPTDPLTIGMVLLVLLMVATLASWLPARRAASIDPMSALRHE